MMAHLMIEAQGGHTVVLHDVTTAELYLSSLAEMSAMTIIVPPVVRPVADGIVGMLVLAESHASIHVIGADAWVDLFTCREISGESVSSIREWTVDLYAFRDIRTRVLERGLETL